MPATQIGGVTRRRIKDGREDEVAARAALLPSLMAAKDAADHQDAQLALQQRALAQQEAYDANSLGIAQDQSDINAARMALEKDALEAEKKQAKKEQKLSVAGLSSNFGMGLGQYADAPEKAAADEAKNALSADDVDTFNPNGTGMTGDDSSGLLSGLGERVSNTDGWKDALSNKYTFLGAFNAPLGGEVLSTATGAKDDDWWTPAVGGGAAAAITDAFVNPQSDFYSKVIDAGVGGATGALFSLW